MLKAGERECAICGADLEGKRQHAVVCGGPCRAEKSRLARILSGAESAPYHSIADRRDHRRKRTDGGLVAADKV